jgi:hypothetical protein
MLIAKTDAQGACRGRFIRIGRQSSIFDTCDTSAKKRGLLNAMVFANSVLPSTNDLIQGSLTYSKGNVRQGEPIEKNRRI